MKLQEALKTDRFRNEQHKAILNILYTAYWYRSHFSSLMKTYGITEEQFNVMRILRGKHPDPMCVKDIASRMLEKSSNVPRIIDRLVLKKYVKRSTSKEDKRETLIIMTDDGLEHLALVSKLVEELSDNIIDLSAEEAEQMNLLLDKFRKAD